MQHIIRSLLNISCMQLWLSFTDDVSVTNIYEICDSKKGTRQIVLMILILPLPIENNIDMFKLPTCLEKRSSFCSQWLSLLALDKMMKIERLYYEQMKQIKGGGVLVEKLFSSFFNPVISLYNYDQYEKISPKKKIIIPRGWFPWKWRPYSILGHSPRYI